MINGIINDKLENIEENKLFPFENAFNYNKNYKCKSYMKRQIWKKHKLYSIEEDDDGYPFIQRYSVQWAAK